MGALSAAQLSGGEPGTGNMSHALGGIADYAKRFSGRYYSIALSRTKLHQWPEDVIAAAQEERQGTLSLSDLAERNGWQDRNLMALGMHKRRS